MNWDTVIEEGLRSTQKLYNFDYGCDATGAKFTTAGIELRTFLSAKPVFVLKPHGSVNWLYCDSCRQLFWFAPDATLRIANQLFKSSDWNTLTDSIGKTYQGKSVTRRCPRCKASALGTRFATFSYRKALDFPMHARTWLSAETLLREAKTWTFIGYSLPAADYEFKHLLKRVQLSRPVPPKLVLITGGDGAESTRRNYEKFFGSQFDSTLETFFSGGLSGAAITAMTKKGALRTHSSKPK